MTAPPRIDGGRLLRRLAELAAVGADPTGGVTRLAYSPEDVAGRALVTGWLVEAGLEDVQTDAACNVLASLPGAEPGLPAIGLGSHLDSVVNAGALDGPYGVLAALEVAAALHGAGHRLRHPLLVVGFSNEEGARGTPGMVGSLSAVGAPPPLEAPDDEGVTLADRLSAAGGRPRDLASAAWAPGSLAGWLELHIEQGPVLESTATAIGVVQAITGRVNLEITVSGRAQHAGTTPMALRQDALAAAARVVLAVESLALDGHVRVATTGRLDVTPGVRNVIAGSARVAAEIRDVDAAAMDAAIGELEALVIPIAEATGCAVTVTRGPAVSPVRCDSALAACFADAAVARGLSVLGLPSGAGHDSQIVAALAPVAMCFVPSRDGISHSPLEATDDADLLAGADVLLDAVLLADERLHARS